MGPVSTDDRIAVVTGAGSGIGRAAALALAADGWQVVLAGRRADRLDAVAASPGVVRGGLHPVPTDVTDERAVRALFDTCVDRFGRVDLLFNNAGTGAPTREIDEVTLAEWTSVVEVNVTGMFLCLREAFRVMRAQSPQGGRIVNNGSIAAHAPRPRSIAYTTTKHAVTGLTRQVQLDGRPFRIAGSQIDIGNAETEMTDGMVDGALQADLSVRPEPRMPVADVAAGLVYLANLPLGSNVATMTVMATAMPFVGRG
jgi:NAD(P)-dependent dehydrogenase (short-subunit alcohol dehydrogenase family)